MAVDQTAHEQLIEASQANGAIEPLVHEEGWYEDPAIWVYTAFFIFLGVIAYAGVHRMIAKALDDRAEGIAAQLDEARKLREEAQANLAAYQRKQRDAEGEAQSILEQAKADAERIATDAKKALEVSIARREALAQDKIAQAEASAVKEVRDTAVAVATEAARKLIVEGLPAKEADELIDASIKDLQTHLH